MLSDKELFECAFPEAQAERESTTFFSDFSIADRFGEAAVRDTYKRAFGGWKENVKYFVELVSVLNHKIWQHHGRDDRLARVYDELWKKADAYGSEHFKGADAEFYFKVLD